MLAEGKSVAEVAMELEISEHTFSRWRHRYGGMKATMPRSCAGCALPTSQ